MKNNYFFPLATFLLIISASCTKDISIPIIPPSAYSIGDQENIDNTISIVSWKDTTKTVLITGKELETIDVSDDNGKLYVLYEQWIKSGESHIFLMTDGKAKFLFATGSLTDSYDYAYALSVKNGDVYMAGHTNQDGIRVPCYWKNGIKTILRSEGFRGEATDIEVVGNDIHVAGYIDVDNNRLTSRLTAWKNGERKDMSNIIRRTGRPRIAADNNDIYFSCSREIPTTLNALLFETISFYTKNLDQPVNINEPGTSFFVVDLVASMGDVYLLARNLKDETYHIYKNGAMMPLTFEIPASTGNMSINSISILGSDIYASGDYREQTDMALVSTIWKNGVAAQVGLKNGTDSYGAKMITY